MKSRISLHSRSGWIGDWDVGELLLGFRHLLHVADAQALAPVS